MQLTINLRPGQKRSSGASPLAGLGDRFRALGGRVKEPTLMLAAAAWVGVLLFFLPLNLAVLAAAAGALGALGNKANLEDDPAEPDPRIKREINENRPRKSQDNSSPVMYGLLRRIFVYLFFVSGLLLFDDKPFSSPGPGQYIRGKFYLTNDHIIAGPPLQGMSHQIDPGGAG